MYLYNLWTLHILICLFMASFGSAPSLGEQVQAALELHKFGRGEEALAEYSRIIPQLPAGELASALNSNAGSILLNHGDYEGALERFAAAVEADPQSSQARFNLAVTLSSKFSRDEEALKQCIAAVKLNSRNHKAYHLMGNIFQNMGKESHAQKYFLQAETIAREDGAGGGTADTSGGEAGVQLALPVLEKRVGDRWTVEHEGAVMHLECKSERPLIILVKNFATVEECVHVIDRADPQLQQSYVVGSGGPTDGEGGSDAASPAYRSSRNTWLSTDEVLGRLQARIALSTGLPLAYISLESEEMQVVKYESAGSSFRVHHDSSAFQKRLLTALVYLADADGDFENTAGEIWFPFTGTKERGFDGSVSSVDAAIAKAQLLEQRVVAGDELVSAPNDGVPLKIKPIRGDAIIFFNHLSSGEIDPAAVHAGLPIHADSVKWVANYWVQLNTDRLHAHMNNAQR